MQVHVVGTIGWSTSAGICVIQLHVSFLKTNSMATPGSASLRSNAKEMKEVQSTITSL